MNFVSKEAVDKLVLDFHKVAVEYIQKSLKTPLGDISGFTCSLKMDWDKNRSSSRGGMYAKGPGVNYAMTQTNSMGRTGHYWEYESFKKDATIGGFTTKDESLCVYALQCHEMAHAVIGYLGLQNVVASHGPEWKSIYADLRNYFINPYVDSCVVDKKKFVTKAKDVAEDKAAFISGMSGLGHKGRDYWNKNYVCQGKNYKVVGWSSRARKYKVLARKEGTQKVYGFSVNDIVRGMKNA